MGWLSLIVFFILLYLFGKKALENEQAQIMAEKGYKQIVKRLESKHGTDEWYRDVIIWEKNSGSN